MRVRYAEEWDESGHSLQEVARVVTDLISQEPTPVVFSEAAVERAAQELWDGADPDTPWEHISEYLKQRTRERARAVLAAAVKEGQ